MRNLDVVSVVDDDESIRDSVKSLLRSVGYQVATFASAELFLESGAIDKTECLILDLRMPGIDGLELQRRLIESSCRVPVIFVTAHDNVMNREQAIAAGAVDFLPKPPSANSLISAVESALKSGERGFSG